MPENHSKSMHFQLQCPKHEPVSQKRQEKMCSILSKNQLRNDYENTLIHIELHSFAPKCVYVLLLNKTEKHVIEWLKWWTKKRSPTLLKYWLSSKKQSWILSEKNSSKGILVLWFPPDTTFSPEKQWVWFENLLWMLGKNLKTVSLENGWNFNTLRKKILRKSQRKICKTSQALKKSEMLCHISKH